jgi:hypothetical protein
MASIAAAASSFRRSSSTRAEMMSDGASVPTSTSRSLCVKLRPCQLDRLALDLAIAPREDQIPVCSLHLGDDLDRPLPELAVGKVEPLSRQPDLTPSLVGRPILQQRLQIGQVEGRGELRIERVEDVLRRRPIVRIVGLKQTALLHNPLRECR